MPGEYDFDLAEFHINRAIECNPNEYGAFCIKAWLMAMTGRSEESIACGTVSHRLNPLQPDNCLWSFVVAHYKEHRYEEGIGALERMHSPTGVTEAWRAACLAQLGRKDEARDLFEGMLAQRNPLGLLSEDIDPKTGELWGNFPQTYSMVGLIHSAMRLSKPWEDAF